MRSRDDLGDSPLVHDWVDRGWPLVVRRGLAHEVGVPLGLPLPPSAGRRRIALTLPRDAIVSNRALPTLRDALGQAPSAWRPTLAGLDALAAEHAVDVGVYGSLGWQCMTGLDYVGPASDVDLAWGMPAPRDIARFLDALDELERRAPMRLDGEVIRGDGAAVHWRELLGGVDEVAIRTETDVVLGRRRDFIEAVA